jgi:DNA sulfur modification protein DndE
LEQKELGGTRVTLNKIVLSREASERLKLLKARTGLAPNILGRIGFCLSLSEPAVPDPKSYPEEDREFNRYTLLGEWDELYIALLRQRLLEDGISDDQIEAQLRGHLHRGILSLGRIAKCLPDVLRLATRAATIVHPRSKPKESFPGMG